MDSHNNMIVFRIWHPKERRDEEMFLKLNKNCSSGEPVVCLVCCGRHFNGLYPPWLKRNKSQSPMLSKSKQTKHTRTQKRLPQSRKAFLPFHLTTYAIHYCQNPDKAKKEYRNIDPLNPVTLLCHFDKVPGMSCFRYYLGGAFTFYLYHIEDEKLY